ncbi:glycosyltransferase family 2 protein [Shewanella kaireitica]|uniref:glycosyltransferase family 2 protein n=1 Tax=Shewanella kaireitica TaxID=212021 RepID=UPI00200C6E9B|nr:glycosyltransferase [Shewanella kaireitica]MCL1095724.1 glycosyltransferase [Shewanella kaireitica]
MPLVSVAVITYNQQEYISEALESIICQNVKFKYEIIVGDDCSTDGTLSIINRFQHSNPNIKVLSRTQNLGPAKNLYDVFNHCKGDYIFVLEGDDFWTNVNKMSEQVNFLRGNSKYIACTHRYSVVDHDGKIIQKEYEGPGKPSNGDYQLSDFESYLYIGHLATLCFRNIFKEKQIDTTLIINGHHFIADMSLNLLLCLNGKIFVHEYNSAVSRQVIKDSGTNYKSTISQKCQVRERILYLGRLRELTLDTYGVLVNFKDKNGNYLLWSILYLLRYPSSHNWEVLLFVIKHVKLKNTLNLLLNEVLAIIKKRKIV